MYKNIFLVNGLHCEACVRVIRMKARKIAGVTEVSVDSSGRTEIIAERVVVAMELREALAGLGYQVEQA